MQSEKYKELQDVIAKMIKTAGSGHYASSMTALEIMYPLFYEDMIGPDQFILSKGHAAPALYAILFDLGYLGQYDLDNFRLFNEGLPGHPGLTVPGVLASSGSLGMGISKAMGLAFANPDKIYHVLVGDGECQEGQIWEACRALLHGPDNVVVHVDRNGHQFSSDNIPGHIPSEKRDNIIIHETTWLQSNFYLTQPKKPDTTYSDTLFNAMEDSSRIIVLNADLEQDFGLTRIKEYFPDRYIQCGICEQHMVSMANGLALAGKVPICHTFSAFYRRAIDQMYNNACDKLRIGYVAGLTKLNGVNVGMSHYPTDPEIFRRIGIEIVTDSRLSVIDYFFAKLPVCKTGLYLEVS